MEKCGPSKAPHVWPAFGCTSIPIAIFARLDLAKKAIFDFFEDPTPWNSNDYPNFRFRNCPYEDWYYEQPIIIRV